MPTQVQFRRGNTSQHSTFTGAVGELTVDTEKDTLVVHDGTTAGGFPVVTALAKQSIIPSTNGTFSLGNTTNRWANLFLSGNTLVIGDQSISSNSTGLNLSGTIFVSNTQVLNSSEITVTTGITVGNSTVNTSISSSQLLVSNVTATNISGNGFAITSLNANSITTGTLNTDRLPATANISTSVNVGANVNLTTSSIQVGNSTVNTQVNSSSITTTTLTGSSINIATGSLIANSTAIVIEETLTANGTTGTPGQFLASNGSTGAPYWANTPATYVQNTDSRTLSGNLVISGTSFLPSSNTVLLGDSTNRWVLSANTGSFSGAVSGITTLGAGNTTITGFVNATSTIQGGSSLTIAGAASGITTLAAGNTTVTGFANVSTSVNSAVLTVGTDFIANTTGAFHTGSINAASFTTTGIVANTTAIVPTSNTILLGNSIGRFVLSANTGNFSGDVTLSGNTTANNVLISGNLTVSGTTTYINSTTLNIGDNIVTLNADVGPGDSPTQNAGLEVNRGSGANVSFIWNETDDAWNQGNTSITGYANISSTIQGGSSLTIAGAASGITTLGAGNTTITGFVNATSTIQGGSSLTIAGAASGITTLGAGNTTITGFVNATSTIQGGGSLTIAGAASGITTLGAGNTTITGFANVSTSVNSALLTVGTNFIANTTGAFHTGTINAASFTVGTSFIANSSFVTIGETALKYATFTTSSISQVAFDTFATATYRSAKYMVQMTSGAAYHAIELSLIHDGTTVYLAQYGEVKSGASLGTFDASITSGTLSVLITPANSVTVVKSIAKLIAV